MSDPMRPGMSPLANNEAIGHAVAESANDPLHVPMPRGSNKQPQKKKKTWLWLLLLALLAVAVIAIGVGVGLSQRDDDDGDDSNDTGALAGENSASGGLDTTAPEVTASGGTLPVADGPTEAGTTSSGTTGTGTTGTGTGGTTRSFDGDSATSPAGVSGAEAPGLPPQAGIPGQPGQPGQPGGGAGANGTDPYAGDAGLLGNLEEGSQAFPRESPYSAADELGISPVPVNGAMSPQITAVWLKFSQPAAAGCSVCNTTGLNDNLQNLMFVYTDICFQQSPTGSNATVMTTYGGVGSADTSLIVFNDEKTVEIVDDRGSSTCSDGQTPNPMLCPEVQAGRERCRDPNLQCPGPENRYQSLSMIDIPIPPGNGVVCYNVAIGVENPDLDVAFVGLNVEQVSA